MALGRQAGQGPCARWEGLRNPPAFPPSRQHVAPVSGDSVSRNLEKFNYGQASWLSPPPPVSEEREARATGPPTPESCGAGRRWRQATCHHHLPAGARVTVRVTWGECPQAPVRQLSTKQGCPASGGSCAGAATPVSTAPTPGRGRTSPPSKGLLLYQS